MAWEDNNIKMRFRPLPSMDIEEKLNRIEDSENSQ